MIAKDTSINRKGLQDTKQGRVNVYPEKVWEIPDPEHKIPQKNESKLRTNQCFVVQAVYKYLLIDNFNLHQINDI